MSTTERRAVEMGQEWDFGNGAAKGTALLVDGRVQVCDANGRPYMFGPDDPDVGHKWRLVSPAPPPAPACGAPDRTGCATFCGHRWDSIATRNALNCARTGHRYIDGRGEYADHRYCSEACADALVAPLESKPADPTDPTDPTDLTGVMDHAAFCQDCLGSVFCTPHLAMYVRVAEAIARREWKPAETGKCGLPGCHEPLPHDHFGTPATAKPVPPAQEAPKAGPRCAYGCNNEVANDACPQHGAPEPKCGNAGCKTPRQNVAQRYSPRFDNHGVKVGVDLEWSCEPCHLLDEDEFSAPTMHTPYAGPERIDRRLTHIAHGEEDVTL